MQENIGHIPERYLGKAALAIDAWQPEGKGGIGYQQHHFAQNKTPLIGIVSGIRMPLAISDTDTFTIEWALIQAQIQAYCRHYYITWASIGYLDHPEQWIHASAALRKQKKGIRLLWHPEIEDPFFWRQELRADPNSLLHTATQYDIILLDPVSYGLFFEEFPEFGKRISQGPGKLFASNPLENKLFELGEDSGIKIANQESTEASITESLAYTWLMKLSKGENLPHILTSMR